MKIMRAILKALRPVIKFIDAKIIIEDSVSTNYYSSSLSYVYDLVSSYYNSYNPSDIYDLDPISTFKDKTDFKKIEVHFSPPTEKHIINYYKENDKIVKGILISLNLIECDSRYLGGKDPDSIDTINFLEETSSTFVEIYMLRDCRIVKFDRFRHDKFLFDFEHTYSLENSQELSVEQFLQHDSPKGVWNNVLLAYHKAIMENENKFPILKKSLEAILRIKEKYS